MLLFGVGSIGSALLCYSVPYTPETLPAKIGAFTLFTSIMGLTMAPLVAFAGGWAPEEYSHFSLHAGGLPDKLQFSIQLT